MLNMALSFTSSIQFNDGKVALDLQCGSTACSVKFVQINAVGPTILQVVVDSNS